MENRTLARRSASAALRRAGSRGSVKPSGEGYQPPPPALAPPAEPPDALPPLAPEAPAPLAPPDPAAPGPDALTPLSLAPFMPELVTPGDAVPELDVLGVLEELPPAPLLLIPLFAAPLLLMLLGELLLLELVLLVPLLDEVAPVPAPPGPFAELDGALLLEELFGPAAPPIAPSDALVLGELVPLPVVSELLELLLVLLFAR